ARRWVFDSILIWFENAELFLRSSYWAPSERLISVRPMLKTTSQPFSAEPWLAMLAITSCLEGPVIPNETSAASVAPMIRASRTKVSTSSRVSPANVIPLLVDPSGSEISQLENGVIGLTPWDQDSPWPEKMGLLPSVAYS